MSLRKLFGVSGNKVSGGIWTTVGESASGKPMQFLICFLSAASNPDYDKIQAGLAKPHRRQIASNSLPHETARQLGLTAFCKAILKGWRNVVVDEPKPGEQPKELEYSLDKSIWLMKELPELYDELLNRATDASLFKEPSNEDNEDAAKNSEPVSSINSTSEFPKATANQGS